MNNRERFSKKFIVPLIVYMAFYITEFVEHEQRTDNTLAKFREQEKYDEELK